ncbi:hypothetical protein VTI28DRAFT_9807 [Corynascus sepedonium]
MLVAWLGGTDSCKFCFPDNKRRTFRVHRVRAQTHLRHLSPFIWSITAAQIKPKTRTQQSKFRAGLLSYSRERRLRTWTLRGSRQHRPLLPRPPPGAPHKQLSASALHPRLPPMVGPPSLTLSLLNDGTGKHTRSLPLLFLVESSS